MRFYEQIMGSLKGRDRFGSRFENLYVTVKNKDCFSFMSDGNCVIVNCGLIWYFYVELGCQ